MTDTEPTSRSNLTEYSVSEISGAVKKLVEDAFGQVRIRGEISGYRGPHSSGHAYFKLKDARATMEAVVWRGVFNALSIKPEEGMEVIATGKMTTYPGSSKYQLVIEHLEPAGAGALMALLEERRKRLAAEGLFASERKRALPYLPRHIGVVTSPTGAVIRDILHRVQDRFPLQVTVWPVRVQGETTPQEVVQAIEGFNALADRPDVLIVARGGGSLEDLWQFNDEAIVRAVVASTIPVISAIGHETDWTLIDHAADVRAPTPTGAAEMAVPVKADLEAHVSGLGARLRNAVSRSLQTRRQILTGAARALPGPDTVLALPRRRFDEASDGLSRALLSAVHAKRQRFSGLRLSPNGIANRIARDQDMVRRLAIAGERALGRQVESSRSRLASADGRMRPEKLARRAGEQRQRLDAGVKRLDQATMTALQQAQLRLAQSGRMLQTLSYDSVLARGFALVRDVDGKLLRDGASARVAGQVRIEFASRDLVSAIVTETEAAVSGPKSASPKRSKPEADDRQDTLF